MGTHPAARPLFHGWYVVAASFAVLFVVFGVGYSFGAFFDALAREFDADRASVSFVFSLGLSLSFVVGAFGGRAADRLGPRRVVLAGMAALAGGLWLAAGARSLLLVQAGFAIGMGAGIGLTYVPAVSTVQRWFVRARGLATGFAVTGIGVGTLVVPFLAAWLIDLAGWRVALAVLAGGGGLLGAGAAVALVADPASRGLLPDGETATPGTVTMPPVGPTLRQAAVTRPFVLLYAAQALACVGIFVPIAHLVPWALDAGLGRGAGVLAVGLVGVGSTLGRFVLGGLADRAGRRLTLALLFAGLSGSYPLWIVADGPWMLGAFALIFGTCYGGYVALIPAFIADYFAGRDLGAIIGVQYTAVGIGSLVGPVLAGLVFDRTGSYVPTFVACIALLLAGAALLWRLPEPRALRRGG